MIRLPLLVVGIALAAYGGIELYQAARGREQTTITCADIVRAPRDVRWIRATVCQIDYMGATWRESRGQIRELFFPVHPAGAGQSGPIAIVAATTDPEVLAVAQGVVGDGRRADQESFTVMGLRIVTILKASREIEGYARQGFVDRPLARQALAAFGSSLAPDFVVVDLHARPQTAFPAAVAIAGIVALVAGVALGRRRRPGAAPAPGPPPIEPAAEPRPDVTEAAFDAGEPSLNWETHQEPPPPAVRPTPVPRAPARPDTQERLPAMMLLNLPASAGADAIERAPALGSRTEVSDRIVRALPGIQFEEDGRAAWAGHDWSLVVSLGAGDPVWTVTVEARGSSAAELAHRLATRTGWRVYVPKRGAFIFDEQPVDR